MCSQLALSCSEEEAERYRRLAENLTDQKDRETVMQYCYELLDRANRLGSALIAPR